MAPVLFALVSVVCVLQTLAAPLQSRAVSSINCSEFNIAADTAIFSALNSFASIKARLDDSTKAALTSATKSMNTALDAAQKAVAGKCKPTVYVAPSTTPGGSFYSMASISEPPAPTTTLRTRPSFGSFAAPQASSTSSAIATTGAVAPENAAVVTGSDGGNANGAMSLAPSMSLASAISLVAIISFF
ncbi:hypothetical protein B0H10DRAFT_2026368 [Mycena sp. CBHHK59/15]|nr:hypothetical protein B0H10DRAFT_2026368 [Mycena sp. CBHHK59/15]